MSVTLFHYHNEGISETAKFDIAINATRKMIEYDISADTPGFAIAKDYDVSEGYSKASQMLKNYFYNLRYHHHCFTSKEQLRDFEVKLAEAIFKNEMGENKELIDDFEFTFGPSKYLFCSFFCNRTKNKTSIVYLFIPLEEEGEESIEKYEHSCLDFDDHLRIEQLEKFILSNGDTNLLQKIYANDNEFCKPFVKNVLNSFANDKYTKINIVSYDEARLENSYVKFLVKLAKYLGYGDYMTDMKQSVKDALGIHMFEEKNDNFLIKKGIELENTKVFFSGKGPDKEILIVMS